MSPSGCGERSIRLHRCALFLCLAQLALGMLAGTRHELGGNWEGDFYGAYAPQALELARGEPYTYTRSGPGYSAVLALASWLTADLFAVAKLVAAASTAALGYLAFLTIRSLASAPAGLLVQVMVYVVLFRFSFFAGNDVFFAALSAASLYFLLRRARPASLDLLFAGALAGLAVITRYPGAALVFAALVSLLCFHPARALPRTRLRDALVYFAGLLATSCPWWIASTIWHGTPFYGKAHALIALDAFGDPHRRLSMAHLAEMEVRFPSIWDVLAHDPVALLGHYLLDFYRDVDQMMTDSVTFPAYLFVGAGSVLLFLPHGSDRRRVASLLLYGVLGFVTVALVPYQARYYYAILFVLLLPVAVAVLHSWVPETDRTVWHGPFRSLRVLLVGLVLAPMLLGSAIKTREYLTTEPVELLAAAGALREHALPGDSLIAAKPHLAFLARVEPRFFASSGEPDQLLSWLRNESGARFLYVGAQEVRWNAGLAFLARGRGIPEGLRLLHQVETPAACLYLVE